MYPTLHIDIFSSPFNFYGYALAGLLRGVILTYRKEEVYNDTRVGIGASELKHQY